MAEEICSLQTSGNILSLTVRLESHVAACIEHVGIYRHFALKGLGAAVMKSSEVHKELLV